MADSTTCTTNCGQKAALLILRLWIGLRLFFGGIEKFRGGAGVDTTWTMENYIKKMGLIADNVAENSILPKFLCNLYAMPLGFLLVGFGVMCLLGIFTRFSLLVAGLLFVSLAFGVMVLPDDEQALYLGLHVAITAYALSLSHHHWLSLDWLRERKKA